MNDFPFKSDLKKMLGSFKSNMYRQKMKELEDKEYPLVRNPRILVVMNAGVGNAVQVTPAVTALRSVWPTAHITINVSHPEMFEHWNVVDNVTGLDQGLQGKQFDHTFICSGNIRENNQPSQAGHIHRDTVLVGKWFLKPEYEYHMDMVRKIGFIGPRPPFYVGIQNPSIDIKIHRRRICIVPGGKRDETWRHKQWPYFGPLIEGLVNNYPDVQICILGAKEDSFTAKLPDSERVVDLRGQLNLREVAWVLKHSDLAVGNDCGPMHIADAVNTFGIVIFGPSDEVKNAPHYGMPLSHDIWCRPCQYTDLLTQCQDPQCMKQLEAPQVLEVIDTKLKQLYASQ